jgi:hypothetical protein
MRPCHPLATPASIPLHERVCEAKRECEVVRS